MSLIRWSLIAVAIPVVGWAALPYLDTAAHRAESLAALKHKVLGEPETPRTVTVYQSTGSKGEAVFSDAHHDQGRGLARVVDNSKGSTFHAPVSVVHDEESLRSNQGVNQSSNQGVGSSQHYAQGNDPIAKMQREQLKFQQRAAEIKQKQMDQIIGD